MLEKEDSGFFRKNIDVCTKQLCNEQDIIAILRIAMTDPCPTVIQTLLKGIRCMVEHFMDGIHMVVEQLLAILKPLLKNRQHSIRYDALCIVSTLLTIDSDRNGIMMDNMHDSIFPLLMDAYPDIRRVCIICICNE